MSWVLRPVKKVDFTQVSISIRQMLNKLHIKALLEAPGEGQLKYDAYRRPRRRF